MLRLTIWILLKYLNWKRLKLSYRWSTVEKFWWFVSGLLSVVDLLNKSLLLLFFHYLINLFHCWFIYIIILNCFRYPCKQHEMIIYVISSYSCGYQKDLAMEGSGHFLRTISWRWRPRFSSYNAPPNPERDPHLVFGSSIDQCPQPSPFNCLELQNAKFNKYSISLGLGSIPRNPLFQQLYSCGLRNLSQS